MTVDVPSKRERRTEQGVVDIDRELVTRAQAGDREALGELFIRHSMSVRRLLISVIGPCSDLDDLAQDVFVQVHRSLPKFRSEARFGTWLHRLTVNVAISYLRRPRWRQVARDPVSLDQEVDAGGTDAHDKLAAREMVRRFYAVLDTLTPKRRVAFALFAVQGYSIAEAAKIVGVKTPMMKSRIWFARRDVFKKARRDPHLGELLRELER
ncbi:MAG: RNA polymerase sigma factor [Deltaproteobacteria bacterium]|nr:RNA polymerase sigma factor [Deltaproteobacteria bacterium]